MATSSYLVHAANTGSVYAPIENYEQRDSLVSAPEALKLARLRLPGSTLDCYVNCFGTVVVVQPVDATDEEELQLLYKGDAFDDYYAGALRELNLTGIALSDFDFSYPWLQRSNSSTAVEWEFVETGEDREELLVMVEAAVIYQLAKLTERAIVDIPVNRRRGRIDPQLRRYTEELFGLERPSDFLTSRREIELMDSYFDVWEMGRSIPRLRSRFDQVTSSYSFYWEQAEKRRESVMNLLLASVAAIGLVAAEEQLGDLLGVSAKLVGYAALSLTFVLVAAAGYQAFLADRIHDRAFLRPSQRFVNWLDQFRSNRGPD